MRPNIELLDKAIAIIEKHPENWSKEYWHDGSKHNLAGHIHLIVNNFPYNCVFGLYTTHHTADVARVALNLTIEDAKELFWSETITDIKRIRNRLNRLAEK